MVTFSVLTLSFFSFVLSASNPLCHKDDSPEEAELVKNVKELFLSSAKGESGIHTVDEFIGRLPAEMRGNFIRYEASESAQDSYHLEPRVVLASPKYRMVVSYSSYAEGDQFNSVEAIFYDKKTSSYKMLDLEFFEKDKIGEARLNRGRAAARPKIPKLTVNPKRCASCHGNPPRFIYDTYNFWAQGMVPFNKDRINFQCKEAETYTKWQEGIEKRPRDRHLVPPYTLAYLQEQLAKPEDKRGTRQIVNSAAGDGITIAMHDLTQTENGCRINKSLQGLGEKEYEMAMRLIAGSRSCAKLTSSEPLLPPEYEKVILSYFADIGLKADSISELYELVREDTVAKQKSQFTNKKAKVLRHFENLYGEEGGREELACHEKTTEIEDRESSARRVVPLRILLEPLGIDVGAWSQSVNPGTYTFADTWSSFEQGLVPEAFKSELEDGCEKFEEATNSLDLSSKCFCAFGLDSSRLVKEVSKEELVKVLMEIVDQTRCKDCHVQSAAPNAPGLLIESEEDLAEFFGDKDNVELVEKLISSTGEYNQMPKFHRMSDTEQKLFIGLVRDYLSKVQDAE